MVVIGNYKFWTDNGGTSPSENTPFTPSSILFRPRGPPPQRGKLVEAPGTAPGSDGFITMAIYRHSRCRHAQYKGAADRMQMVLRHFLLKAGAGAVISGRIE